MLSGLYAQGKINPGHKSASPVKNTKKTISWQASSSIILIIGVATLAYAIWFFNNAPHQFTPSKPVQFTKPATITEHDSKTFHMSTGDEKPTKATNTILAKQKALEASTIQTPGLAAQKNNESKIAIHKPVENKTAPTAKNTSITKPENKILKAISARNIDKKAKPPVSQHTNLNNKNANKTRKAVTSTKPNKPVVSTPTKKIIVSKNESTNNKLKKQVIKLSKQQLVAKYYAEALQKINTGEILPAEALLKKTVTTDNKHIEARKLLAGIYINQQKLSAAQNLLKEGVQNVPEAAVFYHWLGRIYMERSEFKQAAKILLDGSKYANTGEYFALLALAQQNTPDFKKAVTSYRRALKYQPTNSKWWLGLGIVLEKAEDWEAAKEAYITALQSENLPFVLHSKAQGRLTYVNNQIALLKSHE